jgi:hypothetical protein
MAKRRKVIHVASGRIFNTAAEAEREFGLPNSVLSEAIRLGRPCHGEIFQFCTDEDLVTPVPESTTTVYPDDGSVMEIKLPNKKVIPKDTKYEGSPTDKSAASKYFNSLGYTTEVVDGIVQFYNVGYKDVIKVVEDSGYNASWGCLFTPDKLNTNDEIEEI